MDIEFVSAKLAKVMNDDSKLIREYGSDNAKRIRNRLDDMAAASVLEDMRSLPGRCEELSGNRNGQLSLRISANDRLIFEPANDPVPVRNEGGLDWSKVTAIRIREVVDYH